MTSSKTTNTYNRQNWEDSDFPILCNTCLGENPYIRMLKDRYGKECKICSRPFTSFRWCPGPKARYKNTEVCQTCAKLKNVCQTCIFDLEFGLPVQVRDKAIKAGQILPKSDVNREYFMQQAESEMQLTGDNSKSFLQVTAGGKAPTPSDMLMKLARTTPYYRRNLPHICSFWVKGKCARGEECPYRHENPTDPDDPLSDQNIKDRFYGTADPVAEKLMRRYDAMPKLEPPQDKTITTLYIGGLVSSISEKELRDFFYQFGEIRSVSLHLKQRCAFVQFTTRESAEKAAESSYDKLILHGKRLTVNWGKPASQMESEEGGMRNLLPVPGLPVPSIPSQLPLPPPPPGGFMIPPPAPIPLVPHKVSISSMPGPSEPLPPGVVSSGDNASRSMPSHSGAYYSLPPGMSLPPPLPAINLPPPKLPNIAPPVDAGGSKPIGIHYPSMDPGRMGSYSRKTTDA